MPGHEQPTGIIESEAAVLGAKCLRIDNPIATLVRCEDRLFLAVGSVTGLSLGSQPFDKIHVPLLADASAEVSFQIMRLVRATTTDDPSRRHDWRWSHKMVGSILRVPGCLVEQLNPTLTSRGAKPTYLFRSSELLGIAPSLYEHLLPRSQSPRSIPTKHFPYRVAGEACFLCEGDTHDLNIEQDTTSCCPKCVPDVPLDFTKGQRVLEHFAAHQLHNTTLDKEHEHCGLCNRPAPMCVFYLMKGRGAGVSLSIDWERSTCQCEVHYQYAVAAKCSIDGKSPCSNVPVICPTCGPKKPAVWRYNLEAHFRNFHKPDDPATWPLDVTILQQEKSALRSLWKNRHLSKPKRQRKSREPMAVSEAHCTRTALWYVESAFCIFPTQTHFYSGPSVEEDLDRISRDKGTIR
ncbi:hypothetical protein C8R47DRAFT_992978 [Mycena vitilis]|nr:hypothetical protein C8R47DRAFT_992978 [Mycena vitilis]